MLNMTRTTTLLTTTAAAAGLILTSSSASATLVAAESFLDGGSTPDTAAGQYQTHISSATELGFKLGDQDPTVAGFTGPWGGASNGSVGWSFTSNILAQDNGLNPGFGYEQPGSVNYLNTPIDNIVRFQQRELDTTVIAPTSTWYASVIVNSGSNTVGGERTGFIYAGFTNDLTDGRLYLDPASNPGNIGNLFGAVTGFEWDAVNGELDLVLRHRQDTGGGDIKPASNVLVDGVGDNESYAVFMRVDAVAGGEDSITYWVNPTNTGTSETDFTNSSLVTGTLPSFGFNNDAGNWNALDQDLNRAVISVANWNASFGVDEFRLATTFQDMLGINASLVGDLNNDGFVGIDDLNIVLGNWNQNVAPGDPLVGDPSGDGFVGIDDLNEVLGNWNAGTPPTAGAAVPEPTTLALLSLGTVAMLRRKR